MPQFVLAHRCTKFKRVQCWLGLLLKSVRSFIDKVQRIAFVAVESCDLRQDTRSARNETALSYIFIIGFTAKARQTDQARKSFLSASSGE